MTVTAAQKKATAKYEKENYDKILLRLPKGTKELIQNAASGSVNGFIYDAIKEKIERESSILEEYDDLPEFMRE